MRNAADPKAVKDAARKEKERATRLRDNLQEVLGTASGRLVLWELMGMAGVYESVFHRDAGVMAYHAGRQDFGHRILADVIATDATLYVLMEREARERDDRDRVGTEDAAQPGATTEERSNVT